MNILGYPIDRTDILAFAEYALPAMILFAAQTILCLKCSHKGVRLIPTLIAIGILLYRLFLFFENYGGTFLVLLLPYLIAYGLPPLLGVGLGWAIYIIKVVIVEYRELKK